MHITINGYPYIKLNDDFHPNAFTDYFGRVHLWTNNKMCPALDKQNKQIRLSEYDKKNVGI